MNNWYKVKLIFSQIQIDWDGWSSEPEVEILHTYARKGQIYCIVYIGK